MTVLLHTGALAAFGAVLLLAGCSASPSRDDRATPQPEEARAAIDGVLDAFHGAAARADGDAYFALLAPDAVFLGTDASERWTKEEFRAYATPYFSQGKGWTYLPRDRHIMINADADAAWFDERLSNEKYGECRGTGVLTRRDGRWLISQYNLSVPIPNDLLPSFAEQIRGHSQTTR